MNVIEMRQDEIFFENIWIIRTLDCRHTHMYW